MSILTILKDIYVVYFVYPFTSIKDFSQMHKVSTKQHTIFLREFDLLKNFSQKALTFAALEQLVHTPDEEITNSRTVIAVFDEPGQDYGCYFTLARFFVFLLWIAVTGFDSIRPDFAQYTNTEKVFFLLAKMELSKGFSELYNTIPKNLSIEYTLVPPAEILSKVIKTNPLSSASKSIQEEEKDKKELEDAIERLHKYFIWYCSINDDSENNAMTIFKYLSLLKDARIIELISSTEAELIFIKVAGDREVRIENDDSYPPQKVLKKSTKRSKLNFKDFYKSMLIVSRRIYQELSEEEALLKLINNNMRLLEEKNKNIGKNISSLKGVVEKLKEKEVVEILDSVHKLVKLYFDAYSNGTGQMQYDEFIKFCRDFTIFPDLCTKMMLHGIFFSLAIKKSFNISTLPSQCLSDSDDHKEHLDEDRFVKALGLCALESKAFDVSSNKIERILHMLEKISQSPGVSKARNKLGKIRAALDDIDPLITLREKYKDYFSEEAAYKNPKEVLGEVLGNEDA